MYNTPRRNIPMPGDKWEFDDLNITMIIKEDMSNYKQVFDWLKQCIETNDKDLNDKWTDLRISIYSNKNNPLLAFKFVSAFPTSLGQIAFTSTTQTDDYLTVDATFSYAYFDFA